MKAVLICPETNQPGRTQEYLERLGFQVYSADDVSTAAHQCEDGSVDLIVIDAGSDCAPGFSVLEAVREQQVLASLRLLLVCGASAREDIAEAMRLGADECAPAPLDWESFSNKINLLGFDLSPAGGSEDN